MSIVGRIIDLYDGRVTSHGAGCIDLFAIFRSEADLKILEPPHLYSFAHVPQYLIEDVLGELPIYPHNVDFNVEEDW